MSKFNTAYKFPLVSSPVVGKYYHLAWASKGCVWILMEIRENGYCSMKTPASGKTILAKLSDLRETRKNSVL